MSAAPPLGMDAGLWRTLCSMPKAELHVHLEGTMAPETLLELARNNHKLDELPAQNVEGIRSWFRFRNFGDFVKIIMTVQGMLQTADDFYRLTYECGRDMAAQNIRYRELTFTPYNHCHFLRKNLTIADILSGIDAGRTQAEAEFGVRMRFIADIPRNISFPNRDGGQYDPRPAEVTLEYALEGRRIGVVGLGLGGDEVNAPPEPFAHAFEQAKGAGLISAPHAGETMGPDSVWGALRSLQADRIGHGVRSIEDPLLVEELRLRQIPCEVNISSNVCLQVYPELQRHPFPALERAGVLVTVNTDDPPLFQTDLCREYALLVNRFGYSLDRTIQLARNAFVASGAEVGLKDELLAEFDRWAAAVVDS